MADRFGLFFDDDKTYDTFSPTASISMSSSMLSSSSKNKTIDRNIMQQWVTTLG